VVPFQPFGLTHVDKSDFVCLIGSFLNYPGLCGSLKTEDQCEAASCFTCERFCQHLEDNNIVMLLLLMLLHVCVFFMFLYY
jgi:hypothetical protein